MPAPSPAESRPHFHRVAFVNGQFHATTYHGAFYVSDDGADWSLIHTGINSSVRAIAAGNGSLLLAAAEIYLITVPDHGSPVATAHPSSHSLLEDQTLSLSASFTGDALDLVWLKDGQPLADGPRISGATTTTLTISGVTPEDAGSYVLSATNPHGSRVTHAAVVNVTGRPRILTQPASLVLPTGANGVLAVEVDGTDPEYQWFKNGAAISGATAASLDRTAASADSAGVYHVEISNAAGVTVSASASVSVQSAPAGLSFDTNWLGEPLALTGFPLFVGAAVQPDGKVLISGFFSLTKPSGGAFQNLARLNADGSVDETFNPPHPDSQIDAFHILPNGQILVGGFFDKLGQTSVNGFARLNADGSLDASFTPNTGPAYSGPVTFNARADGPILVGGAFSVWGGQSNIKYFGVANADGLPDTSVIPPAFNNMIYSIAIDSSGNIIVGGNFSSTGSRVAKLNSDGQLDATFTAGGAGIGNAAPFNLPSVRKVLSAPQGKTYVGGSFGTYNGQTAVGLMRLNGDGTLDTSFSAGLNPDEAPRPRIYDLAQVGDKLLVAGDFLSVHGDASLKYVTMVDASGQPAEGLDLTTPPNGNVQKLVPFGDGSYLALGGFSQFGGLPRPGLAKLRAQSGATLPLSIVAHPASIQTEAGTTVAFSVAATGHGSLSFQWRKGEANLPGATAATLELEDVQTSQAGEYSVVVTDSSGSVISSTAALSVTGGSDGGFSDWAATFDLPLSEAGGEADPDADGLPNLVEYALGTDPMSPATGEKPHSYSVDIDGTIYPAIQFTRNKTATGVAIHVVASQSVTFSSQTPSIETIEDLGNGLERVTVRSTQPLSQTGALFIRVTVESN